MTAKAKGLKTFSSISQPAKPGSRLNAATLYTVYEDFSDGTQRPVAGDLTLDQANQYMLANAPKADPEEEPDAG